MVRNFLKIIATVVFGFALGWMVGAMAGVFLGAVPSLFFREIVDSNLADPTSISLSLLLGGILGFLAVQFSNKIFEASDKPFAGVVLGIVISLIVVFFVDGVIGFSDGATFDQSFSIILVLYSGTVGSDIGSIIFSLLGATRVVRDILETYKETGSNKERLEEIKMSLGMHLSDEENAATDDHR